MVGMRVDHDTLAGAGPFLNEIGPQVRAAQFTLGPTFHPFRTG
jgi:hypothetical protein